MHLRKLLAVALCFALLVAATPNAAAYKGHQLSRNDIVDFTLIDQQGENFTFSTLDGDVTVVSFIFTSCPDVCPVITQSLRMVQEGLSASDAERVEFVSISVDPDRDTPEALTSYTELHGVDWPHLTGDKEVLADVYRNFGILVEQEVIDAHIGVNQEPTVTHVDPSTGNASELMFQPTGWDMTQAMAYGANWSINATDGQYGHYVTAIEGVESPADYSWWWSILLHNETSGEWEESPVGIDSIDALEHSQLAWAASNANTSLLAAPQSDDATMQVLFPDNTTATHTIEDMTAWHLSMGAFTGADLNTTISESQYGHYMESIDDVAAPTDSSWWWSLFAWNMTSSSWESSQVGMDDLIEPMYIAWAPNSTNISEIPPPGATLREEIEAGVCNDHGWEMGSGEGKHCMCDEGYEWAEGDRLSCVASGDTVIDYSVGHSTITYILDGMSPVVAWTGDSWRSDDFRADVEATLDGQTDPSDGEGMPGLTFGIALSAFGLAAVAIATRKEHNA